MDELDRLAETAAAALGEAGTRDTVEEKILTLQNRKREVIQATIGGEEEFVHRGAGDEDLARRDAHDVREGVHVVARPGLPGATVPAPVGAPRW